jgi:hypothetical protein
MMLVILENATPILVVNILRLIAGGMINVILMLVILMLVVLVLLFSAMITMFVLRIIVIVIVAVYLLPKTGILLINVMNTIVTLNMVYKRHQYLVMITMSAHMIAVTHTGDANTQM